MQSRLLSSFPRPTLPTPATSTRRRYPLLPVTLPLCPPSICSTIPTSMASLVHTSARWPASTVTPRSCSQPRQPPHTSSTLCGGPGRSDRHSDTDFIRAHRLPEMPTDCKYVFCCTAWILLYSIDIFHDIEFSTFAFLLCVSNDLHGHCGFFPLIF